MPLIRWKNAEGEPRALMRLYLACRFWPPKDTCKSTISLQLDNQDESLVTISRIIFSGPVYSIDCNEVLVPQLKCGCLYIGAYVVLIHTEMQPECLLPDQIVKIPLSSFSSSFCFIACSLYICVFFWIDKNKNIQYHPISTIFK